MATVTIGSRLPWGLILSTKDAKGADVKATVRGLNSSKIHGAPYMTTEIDSELWSVWRAGHMDFPPLMKGSIFEAKNRNEAQAKASELQSVKTGLEGLDPDNPAPGIKKMDDKEPPVE